MKSVCIDPGHGGADNGASYGHSREDDINLSIASLLKCLLELEKIEAWMVREKDIYVPLKERCAFANGLDVDLFVSIHCDAWHNETVQGISTHIHPSASAETESVADQIHMSLTAKFPQHVNRGLKQSDFYVLRNTKMPAVLIECEFISNPKMRQFLTSPDNQFAIAYAIMKGIVCQTI